MTHIPDRAVDLGIKRGSSSDFSAGLGIDVGKGVYEATRSQGGKKYIGALEMSALATVASFAIAAAPKVPGAVRVAAAAVGTALGVNAYLVFQDEINKPIGKEIS